METTPVDIHQKQFSIRFRGFDPHEVDSFLEEVAHAFESLQNENLSLAKEQQGYQQEIDQYREREETLKQALLNTQNIHEHMKENSRKSAELIIKDAEVRAERILNRAHNRLAQLHEDIAELKRQRIQIEVQIRSVIDAHTKLLEMGKDEMNALDEEDSKLKFLRPSG